jgi:NADPH:quinone reductase-like Zn-dependent oxidoreductase
VEKLAEAAAPGGIVFEYGALSMQSTPFPLLTAITKGLSIRGYSLMEITRNPEKLAVARKYVGSLIGAWPEWLLEVRAVA